MVAAVALLVGTDVAAAAALMVGQTTVEKEAESAAKAEDVARAVRRADRMLPFQSPAQSMRRE